MEPISDNQNSTLQKLEKTNKLLNDLLRSSSMHIILSFLGRIRASFHSSICHFIFKTFHLSYTRKSLQAFKGGIRKGLFYVSELADM